MDKLPPFWRLVDFEHRLDWWIGRERPSEDLRYIVTEWVMSRADDPYQGVRRVDGFENLWQGVIPQSSHDGQVVACSYWIKELDRAVQCNLISTLSWPV